MATASKSAGGRAATDSAAQTGTRAAPLSSGAIAISDVAHGRHLPLSWRTLADMARGNGDE